MKVLIVEKTPTPRPSPWASPSTCAGDDDFIAMLAANSWFGEHRNSFSHLYQVIREQRGMNYGDYSYIEAFPAGYATQQPPVNVARRSQLFEIWIRPIAMTEPGNLHDRTSSRPGPRSGSWIGWWRTADRGPGRARRSVPLQLRGQLGQHHQPAPGLPMWTTRSTAWTSPATWRRCAPSWRPWTPGRSTPPSGDTSRPDMYLVSSPRTPRG
jgi:hypothetical protein